MVALNFAVETIVTSQMADYSFKSVIVLDQNLYL